MISLEYIAGMFDGSGSVRIDKVIKRGRTAFQSIVTISNMNQGIIEKIQEKVGGKINSYHRRSAYRREYFLVMHGKKGASFLNQVMPFLVVKKEHAQLFLEFVETLRSNHHGERLSTLVLRKRERIYEEFKKINKRIPVEKQTL